MEKISARWVPGLPAVEDKRNCVTDSIAGLVLSRHNASEFLRRYITVDATWINFYTPETKELLKQWASPDEPAPKKAKTMKSAGKMMGTVYGMLTESFSLIT